ncbi:hypothetical protein RSOLAG1IB_01400 [Rhizoctonia solani AG-1 IB]|uniref:Uncharacterized protein n=1 Tax=Thanatephorus cucumeris (strain AG1-IB / isolate 7/3/14) TaxID=1108050 RepID=A0A0B7FCS1_THACB|nr:hypothetical protein RSOLAG1IB_01400 [Rhizoctonia solani AG-1 IB]
MNTKPIALASLRFISMAASTSRLTWWANTTDIDTVGYRIQTNSSIRSYDGSNTWNSFELAVPDNLGVLT